MKSGATPTTPQETEVQQAAEVIDKFMGSWNHAFGKFLHGEEWWAGMGKFDWSAATAAISLVATLLLLRLTKKALEANQTMAVEARKSAKAAQDSAEATLESAKAAEISARAAEISAAVAQSDLALVITCAYKVARRRIKNECRLDEWPIRKRVSRPPQWTRDENEILSVIPESTAKRYIHYTSGLGYYLFFELSGAITVNGAKVWIHRLTLIDYGETWEFSDTGVKMFFGGHRRHDSRQPHYEAYDLLAADAKIVIQPGERVPINQVYMRPLSVGLRPAAEDHGLQSKWVPEFDVRSGLNPKPGELEMQATYSLTELGERRSIKVRMIKPKALLPNHVEIKAEDELDRHVGRVSRFRRPESDPSQGMD